PGGRFEHTVASDEWRGQAVAMVDVLEAEAALDAQHALGGAVARLVVRACDETLIGDVELDAAADAAVRTRCIDPLNGLRSHFLGIDRARRTGGETRAARGADRFAQRLVLERADLHGRAATEQRN